MEIIEEITRVARDLYLKSGKLEGQDLDNWLAAERLVLSWHMPDAEREKHVGASMITEEHVVQPTKDEVTG